MLFGLLFLCPSLFSQEGLYAPFVTRLRAQANGPEVVLTWQDAPGSTEATFEIRRSGTPITATSLGQSRFVTRVAPKVQSFTDRPEPGKWWYAVLLVEETGRRDTLVPWRNTTVEPVNVAAQGAEQAQAARVESLQAKLAGNGRVELTVLANRSGRQIGIYRSARPFEDAQSWDHAVRVGRTTSPSGTIQDDPLPGVRWYYAAIDSALSNQYGTQQLDYAAFAPGITIPWIERREALETPMRPVPLPLLRISRAFLDGRPIPNAIGDLPERQELSLSASRAVAAVLEDANARPWQAPPPQILDVDLAETEIRLQLILKEILERRFPVGDWSLAEAELQALQSTNNLDDGLRSRILFYRGQCLYHMGEMNEAFLSFLVASETLYTESQPWIERIASELTPVGH